MVGRDRWKKALSHLVLGAIMAGAAGLALRWVVLVPVFQSPDEPMHFDYALYLVDHGLPYHVDGSGPGEAWYAHPYTPYLCGQMHTQDIAFHPEQKMPPDYGTAAFYEAVDRQAPPRPAVLPRAPMLAAQYPFGYYALLAAWMKLVLLVRPGPVGLLFGARIFSVVLLAASVALSYATARELGLRRRLALTLTAVIGFLPLTSFVGSYVQPDNLAFTLTSLCFWLALRLRCRPTTSVLTAALGLALGLLLVTKVHIYLCVLPPVLAALAVRTPAPRTVGGWLRPAVLALLPSLFLGLAHGATVWGTPNPMAAAPALLQNTSVPERFAAAIWDFYGATTHLSFWGIFGWMDAPLTIGGPQTWARIQFVLAGGTWVVLALSLLRQEQVASRLVRLCQRNRRRTALRLAAANVPINSFFLFTVLMFVLYIRTGNAFGAQGRNWLPFLLPIFLTAMQYAPRALSLRSCRRLCGGGVALALLLFSMVGSYYALRTIQHRYYAPAPMQTSVPELAEPAVAQSPGM